MNGIDLKVIENGLIPIYENNSKRFADARQLHEFLGVGKDFTNWFKDRIEKFGFIEGEDYSPILAKTPEGGRPRTEYLLTLDTAKEIAMVENNERGRQVRKYFIEVEKRAREFRPMSQAEIIAQMAQLNVELEKKVDVVSSRVNGFIEAFAAPAADDWRHGITDKINQIVSCQNFNHQNFRRDLYKELEQVARVDLESRRQRLVERMRVNGATYHDRDAVTKLDIIDRDPKLRAIFEGIVVKYIARYSL